MADNIYGKPNSNGGTGGQGDQPKVWRLGGREYATLEEYEAAAETLQSEMMKRNEEAAKLKAENEALKKAQNPPANPQANPQNNGQQAGLPAGFENMTEEQQDWYIRNDPATKRFVKALGIVTREDLAKQKEDEEADKLEAAITKEVAEANSYANEALHVSAEEIKNFLSKNPGLSPHQAWKLLREAEIDNDLMSKKSSYRPPKVETGGVVIPNQSKFEGARLKPEDVTIENVDDALDQYFDDIGAEE